MARIANGVQVTTRAILFLKWRVFTYLPYSLPIVDVLVKWVTVLVITRLQ